MILSFFTLFVFNYLPLSTKTNQENSRKTSQSHLEEAIKHNNEGVNHYEDKNVDLAIKEWKKAVIISDGYALPHYNLGLSYYQSYMETVMRNPDLLNLAINEWKKAINIDPDFIKAHLWLAKTYQIHLKQLDTAIKEYREVIRIEPNNAAAHRELGYSFDSAGKTDLAIKELKRAIEIDPKTFYYLHSHIAKILRKEGSFDKAISHLKMHKELMPLEEAGGSVLIESMSIMPLKDSIGTAFQIENEAEDSGCGKNVQSDDAIGMFLFYGASSGNLDMVLKAIFLGAPTDAVDENGRTPLMFAAGEGHSDIVSVLLEDTLEVDYANGKKRSIPIKTNVNAQDPNGATALMAAALQGHTDIIKILIKEGANLNMKSKRGDTALLLAATLGHADVVKILMEHGANQKLANNAGTSPLNAAIKFKHRETIKVLTNLNSATNGTTQIPVNEISKLKKTLDAEATYQRGLSYDGSSNTILAIQEYTKALSIDPNHLGALKSRGRAYLQSGNLSAALDDISKALELQPDDPDLLEAMGICYSMSCKYDKALVYLNKAYNINPHSYQILSLRAGALMGAGRYEAALADYCRALKLDADDISLLKGRGLTYFRLNRYEEAYQDFSRVLKELPEDKIALAFMEAIKKEKR